MTMKPLTMMNSFGCALVAIAIFIGPTAMAKEKKQQKPNVVFILADNVGYGDMGPYEDIQDPGQFAWVLTPAFKEIDKYKKTLKKYPNPPPPNLTKIPAPELKKF
jgi:hypothetical protein